MSDPLRKAGAKISPIKLPVTPSSKTVSQSPPVDGTAKEEKPSTFTGGGERPAVALHDAGARHTPAGATIELGAPAPDAGLDPKGFAPELAAKVHELLAERGGEDPVTVTVPLPLAAMTRTESEGELSDVVRRYTPRELGNAIAVAVAAALRDLPGADVTFRQLEPKGWDYRPQVVVSFAVNPVRVPPQKAAEVGSGPIMLTFGRGTDVVKPLSEDELAIVRGLAGELARQIRARLSSEPSAKFQVPVPRAAMTGNESEGDDSTQRRYTPRALGDALALAVATELNDVPGATVRFRQYDPERGPDYRPVLEISG